MEKFEVNRRNCIHGWWKVPDTDEGQDMTMWEMAQHYVGKEADIRGVRFTPDRKEDQGGHGVFGKVEIKFKRL